MIAVDANVWVYYFDARLAEHEAVRPWLRDALAERTLFVNTAIQMEVIHYFANQLEDTEAYTEWFLSLDGLVVTDLEQRDVSRAGELLVSHPHVGIGGRDASLVAAMERREVDELWTHDTGLKRLGERLDWLAVTDPVEQTPNE